MLSPSLKSGDRIANRYLPPTLKSILHTGAVKPFGPCQRIIRSGSDHAFQTSSRGASKMRSIISASSVDVGALLPSSIVALLPLGLLWAVHVFLLLQFAQI